jgi:adenylate cyclase
VPTRMLPGWVKAMTGWLPTPDGADPGTRRAYSVMRLAPLAMAIHVLYIPAFLWLGVPVMAWVNVLSVLVYVGVMVLDRRGLADVGWSLTTAELLIYAVVTVLLVGWAAGAQYVAVIVVLMATVYPWGRAVGISVTVMATFLFIAGYYYSEANAPLFSVPAAGLAVVGTLSTAAIFAVLALAVGYLSAVAERAENALAAEYARSERLLTNVLPVPIAARLKEHEEVIADGVDGASVLFADIVGFTVLSAQRSPDEVVAMLNGVFTRLDALVDEFGLEKIKTIGDAYMVASGIPVPREDHAQVLARFALAARDELAEHNLTADVPVELRIGINSGPVVAGVIGRRRFLYDLWGDTVNTASRMESHGLPGQVQITEATRALLDGEFTCTERGVIDVKGKGPTRTWLLGGEAVAVPA